MMGWVVTGLVEWLTGWKWINWKWGCLNKYENGLAEKEWNGNGKWKLTDWTKLNWLEKDWLSWIGWFDWMIKNGLIEMDWLTENWNGLTENDLNGSGNLKWINWRKINELKIDLDWLTEWMVENGLTVKMKMEWLKKNWVEMDTENGLTAWKWIDWEWIEWMVENGMSGLDWLTGWLFDWWLVELKMD